MQLIIAGNARDVSGVTFSEDVPEGHVGMRLVLTDSQWQRFRELASVEEDMRILEEVARAGLRLEASRTMYRVSHRVRRPA
jgi:hypothetical protein